ncbi:MAG: O-methyltransferase [Saprospirales bacterium]|nr:O-methyltransferase [Saprospirales bacterium]
MPNNENLLQYCAQHTSAPPPLLQALERETQLHTLNPHMLSGPIQGMLLRLISQMIRPRRILEIGTFTGYSAICLAQGLPDEGRLHTIEANDELEPFIRKYIGLAGLERQIELHLGDAAIILPHLNEVFDLVFLDAGKLDYALHYELALPKLRSGGILLADNALWDGKVLLDEKDATARALRAFNARLQADERVENLLLPLRDGLMIVRKL